MTQETCLDAVVLAYEGTFNNIIEQCRGAGERNVNLKTRALNIDVATCGESAVGDEHVGSRVVVL